MSDGSVVLLTVAEYITPKGSVIQSRGLTPDVKLEVHMLLKALSAPRCCILVCMCCCLLVCVCTNAH